MKNKVKIYAALIGFVYTIMVVAVGVAEFKEMKTGFNAGYNQRDENNISFIFEADVTHKSKDLVFAEKLESINAQEVRIEPRKMLMALDYPKGEIPTDITVRYMGILLFAILTLIIILYIPFCFYQIARKTVVKEVLDQFVIKRITRIGWMLMIYFVSDVLVKVINYSATKKYLILADYDVVFPSISYNVLMLSVLALFLAQVLNMSLTMKEEQDLTI